MDVKYKLKTWIIGSLLLNAIQLSTPKLLSASTQVEPLPGPGQMFDLARQDVPDGINATITACESICESIEKKLRESEAGTQRETIEFHAGNYSLGIAEWLRSCKYCQDVDQAARFSLALENVKKIVSELFTSTMDSYMAQLEPAIAKLEELNRMDSLSDSIATARTKCYDLRNEIIDKQGQISEIVSPILLEPFLLKPGDPVIEFEILTTETDDGQLPMVVYSPAQKIEGQKFPCVVWLHGGSIDSNLSDKDTTLHIEAPDQITSPFNWDQTEHNVSLWLQPLIRFLVSNGVVVATIEMDPKEGNGNLCQQIKDQATIIKGLPHVDPAQTTFFGHSAGGYALSLLLANDHQFLIDNFKSIAFVSPVSNEAWSGGLYPSQYTKQEDVQDTAQRCLDLNKDCYFNFAFPEEEALPRTSIAGKRIGDHKIGDLLKRPECAQFVLEHVYPFSPTCGMSDEQLKPKLALLPQLFILMGTADNNTIPATQGGTLAWRLKEMELTNWCMRIYPNAHHSPHRLKTCYGNPPSKEGFRQMLPDILSIAKGPYPTGTRELSDLSNGGTDVCDMTGQANTMRSFAKRSFFVRRDSGNNAIEFVLFEGTESGREILEATEEKDRIPTVSWPEE